jgi:hypothetical protein
VVRHGAGKVRGEGSPLSDASGIPRVDFSPILQNSHVASRPTHYHRVMLIQYPPVGSKWKELDFRVVRIVQVVRYDLSRRRVRIACLETDKLTWAKVERFNGKSKGYGLVSAVAKRSKRR